MRCPGEKVSPVEHNQELANRESTCQSRKCRQRAGIVIARLWPILSLSFLAASLLSAAPEQFATGSTHRLVFGDVDGNDLSTSDGHVTILTVVTRADEDRARAVADLVPDRYLGDQKYNYITLVNFEGKIPGPLHGFTRAIIRSRVAQEAKDFKSQYEAKKIAHDPRRDIHVIADFDGSASERLGLPAKAGGMTVFVFNGQGRLVARWNEVPPGDSLPRALAEAG